MNSNSSVQVNEDRGELHALRKAFSLTGYASLEFYGPEHRIRTRGIPGETLGSDALSPHLRGASAD